MTVTRIRTRENGTQIYFPPLRFQDSLYQEARTRGTKSFYFTYYLTAVADREDTNIFVKIDFIIFQESERLTEKQTQIL